MKLGRTTNGRQVAVKITAQDKIKPALNEIDFLIKLSGEEHIVKVGIPLYPRGGAVLFS